MLAALVSALLNVSKCGHLFAHSCSVAAVALTETRDVIHSLQMVVFQRFAASSDQATLGKC
jgi:hypothetical protein